MRYIIELDPDVAGKISRYVSAGKYKSLQDFIMTSLQNQLYLEEQEPVTVDDRGPSSMEAPHPASAHEARSDARWTRNQFLSRSGIDIETVSPPELGTTLPYLWGQYNRLFPVKLTLRAHSNLLKNRARYVELDTLQEVASAVAYEVGQTVVKKDRQLGRKRGEILSAALPISPDEYKSKMRFKLQFVGRLAGRGKTRIEGAPATLKFVNIHLNEKGIAVSGITEAGLRFSQLTNPVIDGEDYTSAFSTEETEFMVEQIIKELPMEAKAMRLMMETIEKGTNEPQALNRVIGSLNPEWKGNEVITMRSGLTSRLAELGIIGRKRRGIRVSYQLTPLGQEVLRKIT